MTAPIDTIVLQTRLDAARIAYHNLQTGAMRETVDHNGTRIQYTRADATKLKAYIDELENLLDVQQMPQTRRRMIVNRF